MREWLLTEPGQVVGTDDDCDHESNNGGSGSSGRTGQSMGHKEATMSARKAWPGGKTTSNASEALSCFMKRKAVEPSALLRRACETANVFLHPMTTKERVESLRPPTAAGASPPAWLARLAEDAPQGEHFWG